MDILLKQYDGKRERTRVYHNIDPNSLVIQGRSVYFAHPDCWLSGNCANRYRIDLGGMDYFSSDPEDVERAMQDIPELDRGLCVSSRDRDIREALSEAVSGPVQPAGGDAELTAVDDMKQAVRRLQRGMCTIAECETELNGIIKRETIGMYDLDEIIEAERKLKRKAWRMLLEATK